MVEDANVYTNPMKESKEIDRFVSEDAGTRDLRKKPYESMLPNMAKNSSEGESRGSSNAAIGSQNSDSANAARRRLIF